MRTHWLHRHKIFDIRGIDSRWCSSPLTRYFAPILSFKQQPTVTYQQCSLLSTRSTSSTKPFNSLRSLVKPFLLQCHPDVQTSTLAKTVNLTAIQNLNSYLDTLQSMYDGDLRVGRTLQDSSLVEVDFLLPLPESPGKKKHLQSTGSRRSVQLALPPASWLQQSADNKTRIQRHGVRQIAKLLRVAGLKLPSSALLDDLGDDEGNDDETKGLVSLFQQQQRPHYHGDFHSDTFSQGDTSYFAFSRRRFTRRLNHKKYEQAYRRALADWQADYETADLYKNPANRRAYLAKLLSRCKAHPTVSIAEQWIAMRRLSLLLDEHFERLELDTRLWEGISLVLGPSRDYNVGTTALTKRKRREQDSGFFFRLLDQSNGGSVATANATRVQVEIPVDFGDEELIQELEINLQDFEGDMEDEIFDDDDDADFWNAVMHNSR